MEARIRISCPSCPHVLSREEILFLLAENDQQGDIAERYKRFYADINGEAHRKTCPQCCAIKELDKKLFEGVRWRKHVPRRVVCDECQFVWCFFCHAPWHEKMSCKEYREGEKMLRSWAAKKNQNQQNAQRCPRCKVKIRGCSSNTRPFFSGVHLEEWWLSSHDLCQMSLRLLLQLRQTTAGLEVPRFSRQSTLTFRYVSPLLIRSIANNCETSLFSRM